MASSRAAPIPFVYPRPDDPGKFVVGAEAVAFLRSLRRPVAPIAIAGRARSGKSYLLNQLVQSRLGASDHGARRGGFTVGATVEACTKGIWIWGEAIPMRTVAGDEYDAILLDTEGFGATGATAEHDARIFALATLLCSLLVYNSVGTIDEEAISSLGFIANLTSHIHIRSSRPSTDALTNGESGAASPATPLPEDGSSFHSFFPAFLWVLRDFSLRLVDEDGRPITAAEHLEQSLEESHSDFRVETQARNRIRRSLMTFFRRRDCTTLVRPMAEEDAIQHLEDYPLSALRPEFREGLDTFLHKTLHELLAPKTLNGTVVTGRMLAGLAEAYVAAINDEGVPSIGNAWESVARAENKEALDHAASTFRSVVRDRLAARLPMNADDLEEELRLQRASALRDFDTHAVGDQVEKVREELGAAIEDESRAVRATNARKSVESCRLLLEELRRRHLDEKLDRLERDAAAYIGIEASAAVGGRGSGGSSGSGSGSDGAGAEVAATASVYSTEVEVQADVQRLEAEYAAQARGPAASSELAAFWAVMTPRLVAAVSRARERAGLKVAESLSSRLTAMEADRDASVARAETLTKELRDAEDKFQRELEEKVKGKAELDAVRAHHADLQRDLVAARNALSTAQAAEETAKHALERERDTGNSLRRALETAEQQLKEAHEREASRAAAAQTDRRIAALGDVKPTLGGGAGGEDGARRASTGVAAGSVKPATSLGRGAGGGAGGAGAGGGARGGASESKGGEEVEEAEEEEKRPTRVPEGGIAFRRPDHVPEPAAAAKGGCCTIA